MRRYTVAISCHTFIPRTTFSLILSYCPTILQDICHDIFVFYNYSAKHFPRYFHIRQYIPRDISVFNENVMGNVLQDTKIFRDVAGSVCGAASVSSGRNLTPDHKKLRGTFQRYYNHRSDVLFVA